MKKNMIKKILVVGLGSIGTRHVSNLINSGCNLGIYSYQNRILSTEKGITYESNLSNDVLTKYDLVYIEGYSSPNDPFVDDDTLKISSKKLFLPLILFIS